MKDGQGAERPLFPFLAWALARSGRIARVAHASSVVFFLFCRRGEAALGPWAGWFSTPRRL